MKSAIYFPCAGSDRDTSSVEAQAILSALQAEAPYIGRMVTSYEDVEKYKEGSWDSWCEEVAVRRSVLGGGKAYLFYVFHEGLVGKATFQVVRSLVQAMRKEDVRVWTGSKLVRMEAVRSRDPDSWKDGWEVVGRRVEEAEPEEGTD